MAISETLYTFSKSFGEADISGEELHEILREIDTNMNGQVELDEYLQVGPRIPVDYVHCIIIVTDSYS